MAPPPTQVKINSKLYSVPLLNGDMEIIASEITALKETIASLNEHLTNDLNTLNNLNQQMLALYIQQTGSFPT